LRIRAVGSWGRLSPFFCSSGIGGLAGEDRVLLRATRPEDLRPTVLELLWRAANWPRPDYEKVKISAYSYLFWFKRNLPSIIFEHGRQ